MFHYFEEFDSEYMRIDLRESMVIFARLLRNKIIAHLKLTFRAERPLPPQFLQQKLMMVAESGEYF